MAAKSSMKPQSLRNLLGLLLASVILGGGVLFYFGLSKVQSVALDVNHRLEDAEAGDQQVQQLQVLRDKLSESKTLISNADQMFASSSNYQSKALTDVRNYANKVGLTIASTSFNNSKDEGTYAIIVRFAQPTSYKKLIQFLALTEGNLPKMQVASIKLQHIEGGDADSVKVDNIKFNISVR